MKTEDMIKYGAIAIAAYLLYKWITSQSTTAITTTPETKQLPAVTPITEIKDVTPKPVTTVDIYNAALSESMASRAGSTKFSGHAWNWYRARAGEQAGWSQADVDRKAGGTWDGMDDEITAAQYHAKLKEIGLNGLGMAQSWGGGSMVYTN